MESASNVHYIKDLAHIHMNTTSTCSTNAVSSFLSKQPLSPRALLLKEPFSNLIAFEVSRRTPALKANKHYFSQPDWAQGYLMCHQYPAFKDRWQALIGSWHNKIVVDVGCGPGNVYRALRRRCGTPKLLVGVDIASASLRIAQELGYTPVLADAQQLPFVSEFADIVVANATLHHCDDMAQTLREAARLVRPGGKLIVDHDPQRTMFRPSLITKWIWKARLPLYRLLKRGGHATAQEQYWSTATEVHHFPGDGVDAELFYRVLEPMGFEVELYPHNAYVGSEVVCGKRGRSPQKVRLVQRLSGVNPDSVEGAALLMCVAVKR